MYREPVSNDFVVVKIDNDGAHQCERDHDCEKRDAVRGAIFADGNPFAMRGEHDAFKALPKAFVRLVLHALLSS